MADLARAGRVAQVLLLVAAAYLLLTWYETPPPRIPLGSERVTLSLEAPVVQAAGPWQPGMVLTEDHPGMPLESVRNLTVTARHAAFGVPVRDGRWEARWVASEVQGGRVWWEVRTPLPVAVEGDAARVTLDATHEVRLAQNLSALAKVRGTLDLRLEVVHTATVRLGDAEAQAQRTARVVLTPRGDAVAWSVEGDQASYDAPGERPFAFAAAALVAATAALEPALRSARRRQRPWDRLGNVVPVPTSGLAVPPGTYPTDLESLLRAAQKEGGVLLLDEEAGTCLFRGISGLALTAALPARDPVAGLVPARPASNAFARAILAPATGPSPATPGGAPPTTAPAAATQPPPPAQDNPSDSKPS